MCSQYDPRVYDILSRWSFDAAKNASPSSHPRDRILPSGVTASPNDLSESPDATKIADTHTRHRYSSIVNGLPTFDDDWPSEDTRIAPPGFNAHESSTTNGVASQKWPPFTAAPSPPANLEVLRVMGYRTIFGRGYDERNEFWVHWKGYPASDGTWMRESLVRKIAPLQVAEFNHERRLSCHRGLYGEMFTRKYAPCCDGTEADLCEGCIVCGRGCH